MVGEAFPIRVMPGDNLTIHHAMSSVPPESIIVIDAGSYPNRAVWGEVLAVAAMARGASGVVIDGATRDVEAQAALGFGCWSRAITPAGPHKSGGGTWGSTISCGGVPVSPGDFVLADGDGVVIVPAAREQAVYEEALQRLASEGQWKSRIRDGECTTDVLGLPPIKKMGS